MMHFLPALILLATDSAPRSGREWTDASAKKAQEQVSRLYDLYIAKKYAEVITLGEELAQVDPQPRSLLVLADGYALTKQPTKALTTLAKAIASAPLDLSVRLGEEINSDPDFDSLRKLARFKSLLGRAYASQWKPTAIPWGTKSELSPKFLISGPENAYLTTLRTKYKLDVLVDGARGDLERVKLICTWVHTRWNHVGDAQNQPTDPIGLLDAATKGDNFRCVEYGVTASGCLAALGIPARLVAARAKDVETRMFGAGHVFAEAYLRDQKRWVFLDPQMNVVGEVDGKPANTVEFRNAMSEPNAKVAYTPLLASCFYYFSYGRDERYPQSSREPGSYLLVPLGAAVPMKFQRMGSQPPLEVTHNPADVYGPPPPISN